METDDLKKLIGAQCYVIDPRSKRDQWWPATIVGASVSVSYYTNKGEIYEHLHYRVKLDKVTVAKHRWLQEYHRSFDVGKDKIQIL